VDRGGGSPGTGTKKNKIEALEGLRGFCALAILLSHIGYDSTGARTGGESYFPGYIANFIGSFGNIAVLLFFVLSGFVIGKTTKEPFSAPAARNYLARRMIRLYPIYFVAIVAGFLIAGEPLWNKSFLIHATFMETWLGPTISTNGVLWTLHLEFLFYLLFLLIWSGIVPLTIALWTSAVCCLISPFVDFHPIRVMAYFLLWLLGLSASSDEGKARFASVWFSIFLAIAVTYANVIEPIMSRWHIDQHGQLSTISVLIMSGLLLHIVAALSGNLDKRWKPLFWLSAISCGLSVVISLFYVTYVGLLEFPTYRIAAIFAALAVISLLLPGSPPIISFARFAWLGSISYAMYVIQNPVEHTIYPMVPREWTVAAWWMVNAAVVAIVFVLSYLLERKMQPVFQAYTAHFRETRTSATAYSPILSLRALRRSNTVTSHAAWDRGGQGPWSVRQESLAPQGRASQPSRYDG
jgi:peptidoglycan/LPS O-acetylase OafA/YrhL